MNLSKSSTIQIGLSEFPVKTHLSFPDKKRWPNGLVQFKPAVLDHKDLSYFIKEWVNHREKEGHWLFECGSMALSRNVSEWRREMTNGNED